MTQPFTTSEQINSRKEKKNVKKKKRKEKKKRVLFGKIPYSCRCVRDMPLPCHVRLAQRSFQRRKIKGLHQEKCLSHVPVAIIAL